MFSIFSDIFDLSLNNGCVTENEETTENGINPELAKVTFSSTAACDDHLG